MSKSSHFLQMLAQDMADDSHGEDVAVGEWDEVECWELIAAGICWEVKGLKWVGMDLHRRRLLPPTPP